MDTQIRRTDLDPTTGTDELERRPVLDLSLTQIVGGSLAAASGAGLASTLGVAGTITGAATISVVTAVGGAFYTHSLRRTRERVRAGTLVALRRPPSRAATPPAVDPPARPATSALRPRSLAIGAAAVFGLAIAGITGYELATGEPISGGTSGTTLSEITGNGPAADERSPAEQTPTPDPSQPTAGEGSSTPAATVSPSASSSPSTTTADPSTSPTDPTPSPDPTEPSGTGPAPTAPPPPTP